MSFLIVEITSKGMIFGADKNVTTIYPDGTTHQNKKTEKVLKWPSGKALVGFVGQGQIGGLSTKTWIEKFITDNPTFSSLEQISMKLKDEVEKQRRIDEGTNSAEVLIIHLGGFEKSIGIEIPKIYYITNSYGLDKYTYIDIRKEFKCTEELWKYFPQITTAEDLKKELTKLENNLEPFWFHQGLDLLTFNVFHASLKFAFKNLINNHPDHKLPTSLGEWEKHAKMQILMYGAYFEAFHAANELYVGGGADVVSIEWKSN
ncbi:MAG TPA: hypothetical protein VJ954_00620 [Ignavibacteriaceae bacterium]|nr:hypothetical protein [Ignavibacteriaceae bacterium]